MADPHLPAPCPLPLWVTGLERDPAPLWPLLSPEEQQRARRFRQERDQCHFIVARGFLRTVLGEVLGQFPDSLALAAGPGGKPFLPQNTLEFNLSHSHGKALVGCSREGAVGVDLEWVAPDLDLLELAQRFFAPAEQAQLKALPAERQPGAFFRCWTRKEAYLKALGLGLGKDLDSFAVSLGEPAQLLWDRDTTQQPWFLSHLEPAPDFVGAVAVAGGPRPILCREWAW